MNEQTNIGVIGKPRTSIGESYHHLSSLGFQPKVIIDVGVGYGTPELYAAFPHSKLLLIEPLSDFEWVMKNILENRDGEYAIAAAGNQNKIVNFNRHIHQLDGSSLLKEQTGSDTDGEEITVPMIKIDDYIISKKQVESLNNYEGPYLLKVDVQGAELIVIEGCHNILNDCEVIVLEVSLLEFLKESPQFYEVINFMHRKGFVPYDIVPGWTRPLDQALGQVDIVFVKEHGMFRKDHRFSYPHQTQFTYQ
jgi:FkbM family methyltransferase